MEENNSTTKQQLISWYRNQGFDGETMALIMEDIEAGFKQEQIDSYVEKQIPLDKKKRISKAIHKDLIQDIYTRLKGLTQDRREEVMKAYDSGVPQEVILDMIRRNYSAFHMKKGLENYMTDLAAFAKKTFGMYGGTDTKVTLCCEENLAGVILDRFGKDIMMFPRDNHTFRVTVLVTVSPQFFGWITGIGAGIRIDGPEEVQEEYREYLRKIMNLYEDGQNP